MKDKNFIDNVPDLSSPAYKIRKEARSLPLYECRISTGWETVKLANLSVARQHPDGSITVTFYLVDLMCFGIKETEYLYDVALAEYLERLEKVKEFMDMEVTDYSVIHNIIYAGIAWGEKFGFNPANEFTFVTQFNLEEDRDDIEIMDIECGDENGKPVYLVGPFESEEEVQLITSRLEQNAGIGNFSVIRSVYKVEEFDEMEEDTMDNHVTLLNLDFIRTEIFRNPDLNIDEIIEKNIDSKDRFN